MLNSILLGLGLAIVTISIHGFGTVMLVRRLIARSGEVKSETHHNLYWQLRVLCFSAGVLLLLHIVEVIIWAVVYLMLVHAQPIDSFEESIYFSAVSFTSLGYGDIVLEEPWRLLSAIQAMTGILVCGWSTALLFAVVQRIWISDELGESWY